MKPQKLIMSAFGSYAGEVVIDFSNISHGIFLITGDTGSGKTTIFDAICYALYDRTSGGAREASDMRSQYAGADTPTFVEYTFTYGEEIYVIKRNPKYSRLSKRKDKDGNYKETVEQPGVELTMPDGKVFAGKLKETNEKIMEIIGLDADQFTQIAMIAQGEFMKLLQASSNKRKEIFAKIFDTKIYWQLQEELRRRTKSIFGELEDNRKFCEQELGSIRVFPLMQKQEEEPDFSFLEHDMDGILRKLCELLEVGRKRELEQKDRLEKWQKQIDEKSSRLVEAKQINELFDHLEEAQEEKQRLEALREEMAAKETSLEQAKKAAVVKMEEDKYQAGIILRQECQKRLASYRNTMEALIRDIQELEKSKNLVQQIRLEKEPEYQQQIHRIKDSLPLYEQAQELEKELKAIEKQLRIFEKDAALKQELLSQAQAKLIQKHEKAVEAMHFYQQANDSFIAEQAGIMAAALRENMPCPVCGSTSHPHKAKLSESAVTQQQVNETKKIWQKAEEEERLCSDQITQLREEVQAVRMAQQEKAAGLENTKKQYAQLRQQLVFASKQEAKSELETIEASLQEIINAVDMAEVKWQKATQEKATFSGKIDAEEEQEKRLIQEEAELLKSFEKELVQQGFSSREAFQAAICEDAQIKAFEQQKSSYHDRCVRNEEAVLQLEKQTAKKERMDTKTLSEEIFRLQQERKQYEEENKELYGINQRNEEAYVKLKKAFNKREELKQQYQLYSSLDKTANGNLSGTAKLDFQTYIQRRFFEMIIKEANKRLIHMTSNQFILQCRSIDKLSSQGAVGLDLDVYSLVNDRTRDVKTLSGGESFMAALAMALGMSDVIQNTAGRVKIDTMFVDEGFGSLDDEARGEAIRILQELAGNRRLVGIISHVTELKEQIDCKLMVTKDELGSKVEWVQA